MSNRYMISTDLRYVVKWADDAILVPGTIGVIEYSALEPLRDRIRTLEKIISTPAFQVVRELKAKLLNFEGMTFSESEEIVKLRQENERLKKDFEIVQNSAYSQCRLNNASYAENLKLRAAGKGLCKAMKSPAVLDFWEVLDEALETHGKAFETTKEGE